MVHCWLKYAVAYPGHDVEYNGLVKQGLVTSVPVNVKLLLAVRVLPSAIVNVEPVAGAVIDTLLIEVAEATPRTGVTKVGVLANTRLPEPVSSVIAAAKLADDGVAAHVPTAAVLKLIVLLADKSPPPVSPVPVLIVLLVGTVPAMSG